MTARLISTGKKYDSLSQFEEMGCRIHGSSSEKHRKHTTLQSKQKNTKAHHAKTPDSNTETTKTQAQASLGRK
jgi:hypothetical protein